MVKSHGGKKMWCVAKIDAEYKQRMHEILDLYAQPLDDQLPVVCFDEKLVELRTSPRVGYRKKGVTYRDYEYGRAGTANVFMMTEPRGGRHWVRVTSQRTRPDFAKALEFLAARYPTAITIHLVMDNLNTHCEAALIHALGRTAARRLWGRFTVHYTPKHASWLNQAELALSVMARMCLGKQLFATQAALRTQVTTFWATQRRRQWKINWKWTSANAVTWLKTYESRH